MIVLLSMSTRGVTYDTSRGIWRTAATPASCCTNQDADDPPVDGLTDGPGFPDLWIGVSIRALRRDSAALSRSRKAAVAASSTAWP